MNHRFPNLLVCTLAALLTSCSSRPKTLESRIVDSIHQCPDPANCRIDIRAATTFDWDKLYAFKLTASQADRDKALGLRDEGFEEITRQLVFLKNGKIVYQESGKTSFEHPVKNEVVFDIPDNAYFKAYIPDAHFLVTEREGEDGPYFLLKQIP